MLLILNSLHREYWVHPFNEDVHEKGEFFTTYLDLQKYTHKFFRTYRMSIRQFDALLHLLHPAIEKQNNNYLSRETRHNIEVRNEIDLTLRTLFNEEQFRCFIVINKIIKRNFLKSKLMLHSIVKCDVK